MIISPTQPVALSSTSLCYLPKQQILPTSSRLAILCILSCLLIPRGVELQLGTIMIDSSRILLTLFGLVALNQLFSGAVMLRATLADLLMIIHIAKYLLMNLEIGPMKHQLLKQTIIH